MAQNAIAWTLAKGVAAPIIGTISLRNLEEALKAVKVKLTPKEIKELEAPYVPRPVVGLVNQRSHIAQYPNLVTLKVYCWFLRANESIYLKFRFMAQIHGKISLLLNSRSTISRTVYVVTRVPP